MYSTHFSQTVLPHLFGLSGVANFGNSLVSDISWGWIWLLLPHFCWPGPAIEAIGPPDIPAMGLYSLHTHTPEEGSFSKNYFFCTVQNNKSERSNWS